MQAGLVQHYFDYKSPYAYLAQLANDALEHEFGIQVERIPYTLDIPSFLGRAELDDQGRQVLDQRNAHQWRRVRYAYMDCRREANRRGLVLRGPRKVFDSSLAHGGFLYACANGGWRAYHDRVFERFWRRELDIENPSVVVALLTECGLDGDAFPRWFEGSGLAELANLQAAAERVGVFGVPSWRVAGELFWGQERLPRLHERIAALVSAG